MGRGSTIICVGRVRGCSFNSCPSCRGCCLLYSSTSGCHQSCALPKCQPKLKEKSIQFNTSFSCVLFMFFLHLHLASWQSVTKGHARPAALKCLKTVFSSNTTTWPGWPVRKGAEHCTTPTRASPEIPDAQDHLGTRRVEPGHAKCVWNSYSSLMP